MQSPCAQKVLIRPSPQPQERVVRVRQEEASAEAKSAEASSAGCTRRWAFRGVAEGIDGVDEGSRRTGHAVVDRGHASVSLGRG